MDAVSRPFSQIINGAKQFVIPVFQRDYSWGGMINVNYSCRPTTITFASSPPVGSCQLRSADGLGLL